MLIIGVLAFIRFGEAIIYKAGRYLGEGRGGSDAISILMVNKVSDIWKLPFSYMYSIIMPISLFRGLDSWLALVSNMNICMVPISVGCMLYFILKKKPDKIVYYGTLGYYLIYVITSLNFFRQYAALLPINLIYYSAFTANANAQERRILYLLSVLMAFALVAFYAIEKY